MALNNNQFKTFLSFLKAKQAYINWRENLYRQKITIKNVLKFNPSSYIDSSFTWSVTKEGHDYWRNLHQQWNELLYNKIHKAKI